MPKPKLATSGEVITEKKICREREKKTREKGERIFRRRRQQ